MLKVILSIGAIQFVAIAIQFVRAKFVAVLLGPTGVGIVSTIDQIVQFTAFAASLSLPLASVKFLSKAHSEGHEPFRRCFAGFFQLLAPLALAVTIITVGLVWLRPGLFGAGIEKYQPYLLVALCSMPTLVLGEFFTYVFAAAQNYRAAAVLTVIANAVITAAIIAGILTAGIFGLFIAGSLAGVALTLGIIIYLWKRLDLSFFAAGAETLKELWQSPNIVSVTAMLYFNSVAYTLSLLVARWAILVNYGESETGLLQSALVLSIGLGMVINPANRLYLMPILNRNIEKSQKVRHAAEFQRKIVFILSLIMLPVALFPHLMLIIMFSDKFSSVGDLVFLFIFAQFATLLAAIHQAVLIGVNDLKVCTAIFAGGQIGFALLAWILAPLYGVRGIALASLISSLAIFFLTLLRLQLKHGFAVSRNSGSLISYSFFVLLAAGWVCTRFNEWDMTATLLKIGFYSIFVVGLFFFLNNDERLSLYRLRSRLPFGA